MVSPSESTHSQRNHTDQQDGVVRQPQQSDPHPQGNATPMSRSVSQKGTLGPRRRNPVQLPFVQLDGFLNTFLKKMPMDVVFETLGHLEPAYLLMLARTNKYFRSLLMSRSSRPVWTCSLERVGLPSNPYPDDYAEPALVDAMFGDQMCRFCRSARAHRNVRYELLFVRVCGKCLTEQFFTLKPGPQRNTQWDLVRRVDILQLVPSVKLANTSYIDMTLLEGLNHEYSAVMNDTNALAMWAEQRKKFVEQTNEYSKQCTSWLKQHTQPSTSRFVDRIQQLVTFLKAEDEQLEEEFWRLDSTEKYAEFSDATSWRRANMTEKRWVAIRPAVFKFLKQHREKRLVNSEDLETPVVRKAWVALPCTGY